MGLDHRHLESYKKAHFAGNYIGQNNLDQSGYVLPKEKNLILYLEPGSGGLLILSQPEVASHQAFQDPLTIRSGGSRFVDNVADSNHLQQNEAPQEKLSPFTKAIDTIKTCFHLTDEQLSLVLGCTRKTLNNWRNSVRPTGGNAKRIWRLLQAADDWQDANYPDPFHYLERSVIGEKTLLDILGSEDLNLDEVSFAGNKMLLWNSELGDE